MSLAKTLDNPIGGNEVALKRRSLHGGGSHQQDPEAKDEANGEQLLDEDDCPRIGLTWQFIWFVAFQGHWVLEWYGSLNTEGSYLYGIGIAFATRVMGMRCTFFPERPFE